MLNRKFLLSALLIVGVSFLVAFSNARPESNTVYEYVTIQQSYLELIITEQGKPTMSEGLKKDKRTLNYAFEFVNQYEAKGYELYDHNEYATASGGVSSFMLRRKKDQL